MVSKRFGWIVSLLLVTVLVLTACGTRPVPSTSQGEKTSPQEFLIELPRITVNIDEQGTPTVMGMSLADLAKLTGSPMAPLQLTPEQVTQFQANNIQELALICCQVYSTRTDKKCKMATHKNGLLVGRRWTREANSVAEGIVTPET